MIEQNKSHSKTDKNADYHLQSVISPERSKTGDKWQKYYDAVTKSV